MTACIDAGWLVTARRCESPNCGDRPDPADIDLLVIHNISLPPGEYGGDCIAEFFCNRLDFEGHPYFETLRELQVSAHLLVRRDGGIEQYVPFHRRAWHAGQSCYQGRENCNDFSIGIELEGCDDEAYTEAQYQSLAEVSGQLFVHYPKLSANRVCGHSDIAPGRKTDPGPAFDWIYYRALITGGSELA
jgi:AmpD protein